MYKLTDEELSEAILQAIDIDEVLKFGGDKEKIKRKLNEFYQYHPKTFSTVNKGDYSLLRRLIDKYIFALKFDLEF